MVFLSHILVRLINLTYSSKYVFVYMFSQIIQPRLWDPAKEQDDMFPSRLSFVQV